jgi:type VI secretion system secreted protein Hcp
MAVDMFLKLDGIKGESKDDKHKEEIHIESWSWGLSQQGNFNTGGGGGAGKVNVHDISITKYFDKSSPDLMFHLASGKHIASGLVTVRKAGEHPVEYLKIKLTDLLVSSIQHSGASGGSDLVMESLSLNFAKFNVEYSLQDEKGKGSKGGEMGWDIKANKKL